MYRIVHFRYLLMLMASSCPNRVHALDAALSNVLKNVYFILKMPHLKIIFIKHEFRCPFARTVDAVVFTKVPSCFPKLCLV